MKRSMQYNKVWGGAYKKHQGTSLLVGRGEGRKTREPCWKQKKPGAGEGRSKALSGEAGARAERASSGVRGGKAAGSGEVWVSLSREKVGPVQFQSWPHLTGRRVLVAPQQFGRGL